MLEPTCNKILSSRPSYTANILIKSGIVNKEKHFKSDVTNTNSVVKSKHLQVQKVVMLLHTNP
jgi:hypothetical protein